MDPAIINLSQYLKEVSTDSVELDNYNFIPTVKYRATIKKLCAKINKIENIRTYCPAIATSRDRLFYTSSDPAYSAIYLDSGLYRADNYFRRAYSHSDHYLITAGEGGDHLQKSVVNLLENRFGVYNTFCLIRRCEDCVVMIAVSHTVLISKPEILCQKLVTQIEDLSIEYFDTLIDLYTDYLPGLKFSRFATDSRYRAAVLRKREQCQAISHSILTGREKETLYWVSKGKTSYEISKLMTISEYTVNEHKKSIMKKLNTSNMVYSVREALKNNIIG